jgi:hypothetical protein
MSVHGRKAADEALVLALACGATVESAADKAKVSKRTAYRRLKDTKFVDRIRAVRVDMRQRMSGALTAAGMGAIKTLLTLLEPTTPPAVRLGAARALVDLGHKAHLLTNLEERLAALEQQVAGTSPVSR